MSWARVKVDTMEERSVDGICDQEEEERTAEYSPVMG